MGLSHGGIAGRFEVGFHETYVGHPGMKTVECLHGESYAYSSWDNFQLRSEARNIRCPGMSLSWACHVNTHMHAYTDRVELSPV